MQEQEKKKKKKKEATLYLGHILLVYLDCLTLEGSSTARALATSSSGL